MALANPQAEAAIRRAVISLSLSTLACLHLKVLARFLLPLTMPPAISYSIINRPFCFLSGALGGARPASARCCQVLSLEHAWPSFSFSLHPQDAISVICVCVLVSQINYKLWVPVERRLQDLFWTLRRKKKKSVGSDLCWLTWLWIENLNLAQ